MTNRRRSGKGRTSITKKSESPDKQTKKLSRRSRRGKKSESPERPDGPGSDYSGDEADDTHNKRVDEDEDNDNSKGECQFETGKSNDDQRTSLKEEESGGSDGSWKVKSENGGGGGIPKLKLCLTRPPEMSSPTSTSEQNPSPRRKKRSGRSNVTPTKEDEESEENITEEYNKRVTRNQKAKEIQEVEVINQEKSLIEDQEEKKEDIEIEVYEVTNIISNDEENETIIAVQSISNVDLLDCHTTVIDCIQEKTPTSEENEEERGDESEEKSVTPTGENYETAVETNSAEPSEKHDFVEEKKLVKELASQETVTIAEAKQEERHNQKVLSVSKPSVDVGAVDKQEKKVNQKEEIEPKSEASEPERESKNTTVKPQTDPQKEKTEPKVETTVVLKSEQKQETNAELDVESGAKSKAETECVIQTNTVVEKRRSSSRDSSEERAKEAALRSRNKNKRKEGSEEGEMIECPGEKNVRNDDKNKVSSPSAYTTSESDRKGGPEEPTPPKSGARKRRWGSSTTRTSKKPSVSISTDVLKEIIPEVKPLLMSEVQLSPNEEDEEGQLKDSEENLPVVAKKIEREKVMQSDESEKDYEEEAVESGVEEPAPTETAKQTIQVKEKEFTTFTRKVSVMSSNERLQKSPSPPRYKPSNILYIVNLVRPFTIPQLRELLARTGTITEDGFWIDKIKSKCYVKYETEEEAKATRHALHGVRWPVSNPKQLNVDFGTEAAMKAAMEGNEVAAKRPIPSLFDKPIDLKANEKSRDREKDKTGDRRDRTEKDKKERGKHRDDDKKEEGEEDKDKKLRPSGELVGRDRTVRRVTMPVREWDVGKNEDGFSPPPDGIEFSRHRDDRYERRVEYDKRDEYDERRRRDKDRSRRSVSDEPPRKSKKKSEEEAPAKMLDDLFRKTKATPCIYWLPLTPEQISVKEEMRRKHMAEHEKKVAELRKMQREQSKRSSDKRRRRTRSRSRSRSAKK